MTTYGYNTLLQWSTKSECWVERVLWVDDQEQAVVVFRIGLGKDDRHKWKWPVWRNKSEIDEALKEGNVRILPKDSFLRPKADEEELEEEDLKRWRKLQAALDPIINDPQRSLFRSPGERWGQLSEAASKAGIHRTTLYKLLVKFWTGGQTPQCLLPDYRACGKGDRQSKGGKKRGRPNAKEAELGYKQGVALTEDITTLLLKGRDKFYNKEAKTLKLAYELTLGEFFNDDYEIRDGVWVPVIKPEEELPQFSQFAYVHRKHRDPEKESTEREGPHTFKLKGRALLRNTESELLAPGQVGQMDSTTADIYLVSEVDGAIIGRPTVYALIDAWGRFMYSIVATWEHSSYWAGTLALETALVDKVEYCAGYGIKIREDDWPVNFWPAKLVVDGGEMAMYQSDNLVKALGLQIDKLPAGRGDLKGIIEQHFRKVNNKIVNWLPGAKPRFREDRNKRLELDAVLTINEFRYFLIEATLKYHQALLKNYKADEDMMAAGVAKRPIEMLRWARDHKSGLFRHFDLAQARLQLLPGGDASITKHGIRFQGVHFTCERLVSEKWIERARRYGSRKVDVAFDPRRVEPIFLRGSNDSSGEPCHLAPSDVRFRGRSWDEVKEYRRQERIQEIESAPQEAQDTVELHAKATQIEQNALARKKEHLAANPGQSKSSHRNNMTTNRAKAKAKESADSLQMTESPKPQPLAEEKGQNSAPPPEPAVRKVDAPAPKQSPFTQSLRAELEEMRSAL